MKKSNLPIEVHDHFRKANVLHGYVCDHLSKAAEYAPQVGQELLAAKKAIPHGGWESECGRLFDASLRNAQFYMQITRDLEVIPKAQKSAILFLEGTLDGTAKAARKAAIAAGGKKPPKSPPKAPQAPPPDSDPFDNTEDPFGEDGGMDSEDAQEPGHRPPRKGKDKPVAGVEPSVEDRMKDANSKLESLGRAITAHLTDAKEIGNPHMDEGRLNILQSQLKTAAGTIRAAKGAARCAYCRGDGCKHCYQTGWLDKSSSEAAPRQ